MEEAREYYDLGARGVSFSHGEFRTLINATSYWIAYRSAFDKGKHLSERSLSEPITDFLLSKAGKWVVSTEHNHPLLLREGAVGRPKQIDFALVQGASLRVALETKWAPSTPDELIEDICRLGLLNALSPGLTVRRYLILAGRKDDVQDLLGKQYNAGKCKRPLLENLISWSKDGPERNFRLDNLPLGVRKRVAKACIGLGPERTVIQTVFGGLKTVLVQDCDYQDYRTLGWRIERRKGVPPVTWERLEQWENAGNDQ